MCVRTYEKTIDKDNKTGISHFIYLDYLDLYLIHWPVVFKPEVNFPEDASGLLSLSEVPLIETWEAGDSVNLECALTLQKSLGGHLVTGHVDGTGELIERQDATESTRMTFETTGKIGRFIAIKGSVAVDGISLTSNTVKDVGDATRFEVTLVPHTLSMTTLGSLRERDRVHLEIDLIARYLERMNESDLRARN